MDHIHIFFKQSHSPSFKFLFAINKKEDLGKVEELASLQNRVEVWLQEKLGKQNFLENMKKVFEPVTDTIKNTSENLTKL